MGITASVCWIVVECICRILGVSTATVLCAVGVETLQQGEFNSLGIYLLVSSIGIMMFELAYFLNALLLMCLPPPDSQLFVVWGKMARIGGFHKFLYYSIMSVVCFLHPVLVWHATIPGTMLLVTAFFNFILSKKAKIKSPKRPQEGYRDQGPTNVCVTEAAGSEGTLPFFHMVTGRRGGGLGLITQNLSPSLEDSGESVQAMLDLEQTTIPKDTGRERRRWRDRTPACFRGREEPVEREMEEMDDYCEPDITSDNAPMITD
ncbi:transmembrane protein 72 isoform X2 [Mastacembelus armatus]|uniref:transmembrane protein 72 isoform X2 n=1 Tax=Mastacembelus armatus TaxID=205130 RepID=UPI000E460FE3|nr:transmembrane protein 72 isoform X2 [Mastacembelus armatus]